MIKLSRIAATALTLVLVVFLLSACGGDETAAPTAQTVTKTAKSASSTTGKSEDLVGQVVTPGNLTPDKFKASLSSRRPIVVLFYMNGPSDDTQVRSSVQSLENKYRSQADFYDYVYSDGQTFGDLAMILKVSTTPAVITINKQSQVQRAWSGYVDAKSIEQGIVEAISN
ncbi:MAG: thioredoxin domain-containing protein [Thermoleophilia bacterium]